MPSFLSDYQVTSDADDSVSVRLSEGIIVTLDGANACANLQSITAVGVKHLSEVETHAVNTIAGSRSHVVRFINGGVLQFAYNNAGDLIDLCAENLVSQLSGQGELLFCCP